MTGNLKNILIVVLLSGFFFCAGLNVFADEIIVKASIEDNRVSTGEPFIYTIKVEGSLDPGMPDIPDMQDFTIEYLGGQQISSNFTVIINGQKQDMGEKGYIFQYKFIPRKIGNYKIPSVTLEINGRDYSTRSLMVYVSEPEESDDYKLSLSLSKVKCYPGEPVLLTVIWYFANKVHFLLV